jgi:hypothetical protein
MEIKKEDKIRFLPNFDYASLYSKLPYIGCKFQDTQEKKKLKIF